MGLNKILITVGFICNFLFQPNSWLTLLVQPLVQLQFSFLAQRLGYTPGPTISQPFAYMQLLVILQFCLFAQLSANRWHICSYNHWLKRRANHWVNVGLVAKLDRWPTKLGTMGQLHPNGFVLLGYSLHIACKVTKTVYFHLQQIIL